MIEPQDFPDQMISRLPADLIPKRVMADIPGGSIQPFQKQFDIQFPAEDGTLLLRLFEENGRLCVVGDESRWDEAAKKFLYGMLQWSGQVGIRWKDEVIKAAEEGR